MTLEIVHLTKRYGNFTAVDDLSLRVEPGEIVGLLGPNGAGKTTTMKVIAGLLRPTSGTVRVAGHDVIEDPLQAKAALGYMPEAPFLYERLTGDEFLRFVVDLYALPAGDVMARAHTLADLFGLKEALGDRIQGYSRGMRQKLALISVLMREPRVLVLDEPITGLDPISARAFKDLLREQCRRGAAILFSTHILEVAERLCDRVAIIHQGHLVACGTMSDLQAQSRQPGSTLEDLFLSLTGGAEVADLIASLAG